MNRWRYAGVVVAAAVLTGCSRGTVTAESPRQAPAEHNREAPGAPRLVRATGIVQAREWQLIRVPQLSGIGSVNIALTQLIQNGAKVSKGDVLAEFDRLTLLEQERDAAARVEDLSHQLNERKAQVRSLQATRASQIREAQADIETAQLQLRKQEVLSEVDRAKNQAKAENAKLRLASLERSNALRAKAEEASIKVLELKLEREKVTLEQLRMNLDRLVVKAPQDGMVVLENTYRQGSMGPPQVGDRMWPGMALMRVFNPASMVVEVTVDEPDFAAVSQATRARVYLDAYPEESFDAVLAFASPVATTGLGTQIRTFLAVFHIQQQSPILLPDLSAALEIDVPADAKQSPAERPQRRAAE